MLVSAAATLITQRAVIANQTTPAEGQAAMIQKLMMVGIPISVVFSGFIFPLGVLLYWFTSNLWTMFQQFYIFKFHPHTPGGTVDGRAPAGSRSARASAPKVGQKPVHPKSTRPTITPNTTSDKISLGQRTAAARTAVPSRTAQPTEDGPAANARASPAGWASSEPTDRQPPRQQASPEQEASLTLRPGHRPGHEPAAATSDQPRHTR